MEVFTPLDKNFNYLEAKALYKLNESKVQDISDFDKILQTTLFYSFYTKDNGFVGCLYFYQDNEGKLFVNGFANRKKHLACIAALRRSFNWFNCDIYARTPHRAAAICLLRAGFKKVGDKLYIKKKGE